MKARLLVPVSLLCPEFLILVLAHLFAPFLDYTPHSHLTGIRKVHKVTSFSPLCQTVTGSIVIQNTSVYLSEPRTNKKQFRALFPFVNRLG
jgi:hypothetical protein